LVRIKSGFAISRPPFYSSRPPQLLLCPLSLIDHQIYHFRLNILKFKPS
ncbi:hypothetical protein KSS87_001831, partial [Heliosperma pusillum]